MTDYSESVELAQRIGIRAAARELGIPRTTLQSRVRKAGAIAPGSVSYDVIPEDDIPIEAVIRQQAERFEARAASKAAREWQAVKVNEDKAIGVLFVGDVHISSPGCNIPLFLKHAEMCKNTDGLYGVNLGDVSDAWGGRLSHLLAEQEVSRSTEWRMADWVLNDCGIDWLAVLIGNHKFADNCLEVFRLQNRCAILMEDWQAKFRIVFPNKKECKVNVAHNFKGNSQWNLLHGNQKEAKMGEQAHIYACGHHHDSAIHQEENGARGFVYWLLRARGYKHIDEYATVHGFPHQKEGSSVLAVIDPKAKTDSSFVTCFLDAEEGVEFLKWKRQRD